MCRLFLSLAILLSTLSLIAADGESGRGYLLLHKTLDNGIDIPHLYAVGQPITVNITLYNIGEGAAYSINVNDQWPSGFAVQGQSRASFQELAAGGRVSYNFTVTPSIAGDVEPLRAAAEYQSVIEGPVVSALSSPAFNVTVVSEEVFGKLTAKHVFEWILFTFVFGSAVILPLSLWLQIQTNYLHGLPKSAFSNSKLQ